MKKSFPIQEDVKEVNYCRNPTKSEIKFGYGTTYYRDFPIEECCHKGTRILKRWFKSKDDGLRYYR